VQGGRAFVSSALDNEGMTFELQAQDRILVLQPAACGAARLREWAGAARGGVVVGLGEMSEIRHLRSELADCDNILFTRGSHDEIPWRDAFFTVVVDAAGVSERDEIRRVLDPAGRIYSIQP